MQRAVFTVVLSFLFFLAMMIAYYIRQNIGYFLLASAFLVIYIVMMVSLYMQRRNVVEVLENGLRYKKDEVTLDQIASVSDDGIVTLRNGRQITLPKSLDQFPKLILALRAGDRVLS